MARSQIGDQYGSYTVAEIVFDEANPRTGSVISLSNEAGEIRSLPLHTFKALQADRSQPLWVHLEAYFGSQPAALSQLPASSKPILEPKDEQTKRRTRPPRAKTRRPPKNR